MTDTSEVTEVPLSPFPEPGPKREQLAEARLQMARQALTHSAEQAAVVLEESLRAGLWRYSRLWLEFGALPDSPVDYVKLKALWLDSPRACRTMRSAITVLARAAAIAEEYDESRILLRKAILLASRRRRRLSTRLKRFTRMTVEEALVPIPRQRVSEPQAEHVRDFFTLYEAVCRNDQAAVDGGIAALRGHGEGEWLDRI